MKLILEIASGIVLGGLALPVAQRVLGYAMAVINRPRVPRAPRKPLTDLQFFSILGTLVAILVAFIAITNILSG